MRRTDDNERPCESRIPTTRSTPSAGRMPLRVRSLGGCRDDWHMPRKPATLKASPACVAVARDGDSSNAVVGAYDVCSVETHQCDNQLAHDGRFRIQGSRKSVAIGHGRVPLQSPGEQPQTRRFSLDRVACSRTQCRALRACGCVNQSARTSLSCLDTARWWLCPERLRQRPCP